MLPRGLLDTQNGKSYTDFYFSQYNFMLFSNLSTAAQTAFAALSSAGLMDSVRSVASVPGSFSRKRIKERDYWYYQTADLTGKQMQIFLGVASEELTELIEKHRSGEAHQNKVHTRQLARQAIAAGCPFIMPTHAKILARLSDTGFFKAGGILVGTHVYMGYQNHLGVRWQSAAQTLDLDFAHAGKNISVAIPSDVTMDVRSAIESLKMGFVPVESLTTYVKSDEADLQIDFVTSMHRGGDTPVLIKALNATMQPLKFMEFSMSEPIQMTLLTQMGPIIVNAPPPEKYAVHKLIVYGERPQKMRIKSAKDLEQAATLISYLTENDADTLSQAWNDLMSRGPGWRSRALQGLEALQKQFPDVDTSVLAVDKPTYAELNRQT